MIFDLINNRINLFILLFVIYCSAIPAQTESDSLQYSLKVPISNLIFSSFEKQLNTYNLTTGFTYGWSDEKFSFGVNQIFRSTLTKTSSKSVKDDQHLVINGLYNLNDKIRICLNGDSKILSDDRQLAINQASINHATIYTEAELLKDLVITPFGGYSNNRQVGENDNGPLYGVEGYLNDYYLSDLSITNSSLILEPSQKIQHLHLHCSFFLLQHLPY